jgi:uncharacterized protein involved in exopolysaccharide biosynthesis/Mrp family chromosome partitioning ATPase
MSLYSFGKLEWQVMSRAETAANDVDVDLGALFSSLARNWVRILLVALVLTALALVFAWIATPLYRAQTRILIETRESVFTRPNVNDNAADNPNLDQEGVTSQVQVISSTDILKEVARKLKLGGRPEFDDAANEGLVSRILVMAGLESDPRRIPPEERVLQAMREKLNVYRIENSRVIVIEFSSQDPKLAAAVPNAIAEEYIAVQKGAKLESNNDATSWLQPEIADLSKKVKAAEAKVADFRAKSGLLLGQNNGTITNQQLSDMAAELSRVKAARADAEAKALSVKAALDGHASLGTVPGVLASGLMQRLRERQVQLRAQIADLSTTLLPDHPRMKGLQAQLSDLNVQIRNEAQKILQGLQNEAHTAKLREDQLTADLNRTKAAAAQAGEQQVELDALQREAKAERDLLESYLTRYREASSRGNHDYLPVDARIFSRATVPAEPYFPKRIPIVGAAFVASLLVMAVITLLQELFSGRAMRPAAGARIEPVHQVVMPAARPPATASDAAERALSESPMEAGGELSIRDAAARLVENEASRAIFLSPEGDAGAAASILVAREIADAGLRVLLLDLTETGAVSHATLDSDSYAGITNLLSSEAQFTDVIHTDLYSDCHVMPVGTADPEKAMRAVDRLPIILNSLTTAYDIVVVECGAADPESIRRLVSDDSMVLVSAIEIVDSNVAETTAELEEGGYKDFLLVTPAGYEPSYPPQPGRSAA